jgi:hypothetical protein
MHGLAVTAGAREAGYNFFFGVKIRSVTSFGRLIVFNSM